MFSGIILVSQLLSFGAAAWAANLSPSHESTRHNAELIFNAIHSAGRQWGSSYYHNGFSFFPAVMPQGTLLYHGAHRNETPAGPEWLAFEIEHAENFARSMRSGQFPPGRGKGPGGPGRPGGPGGKRPGDENPPPPPPPPRPDFRGGREELRRRGRADRHGDKEKDKNSRGYLHVYQANRDLNLLLIDGMSAGKTRMGTLDSQDLVLRENTSRHDSGGFDEWPRALDICDIMAEWGYDGVVRMEVGFEVIHCNFTTGVDLVSMTRTMLPPEDTSDRDLLGPFEWTRAVAERYDGIGGDRLRIDFSSMVSGLFFPINISSTDADRPDLLRLGAAPLADLKDIKSYLAAVAAQPRRFTVNWQAIVDLVVSRFGKRLAFLGSPTVRWNYFVEEIEAITLSWFDAPPHRDDDTGTLAGEKEPNRTADAIERCRRHFLRPTIVSEDRWGAEDELVFTAIDVVVQDICTELFTVRAKLVEAVPDSDSASRIKKDENNAELQKAVEAGRTLVQGLMARLGWTLWKQTPPCAVDEVEFIAMWPFGEEDDHWNPGCRSIERLRQTRNSYWHMSWGPPPQGEGDDEAMPRNE